LKLASVIAASTGEPMLAKLRLLDADEAVVIGVMAIVDASDPSREAESFWELKRHGSMNLTL